MICCVANQLKSLCLVIIVISVISLKIRKKREQQEGKTKREQIRLSAARRTAEPLITISCNAIWNKETFYCFKKRTAYLQFNHHKRDEILFY